MSDRLRSRWLGIALTLIGVISIGALALSGQLELYIHPRYTVFTVIMAVLAGAASIAAILVVPNDHHDDAHVTPARFPRAAALGGVLLLVGAIVALLVIPPTTLSASTAQNRDVSTSSSVLDDIDTTQLIGGDPESFTVKDWATLLRQGLGLDYFAGTPARISGFVVPTDDPDVFYLARFLVTCCAVDAQPLGVPVHLPNWAEDVAADEWLEVSGSFDAHPDAEADEPIVLVPASVEPIDRPAQPYVY